MSKDEKMNSDKSDSEKSKETGERSSRRRRRAQRNRRHQDHQPQNAQQQKQQHQSQKQQPQKQQPQRQEAVKGRMHEEPRAKDESSDKFSRANMIVLVDDDPAYVEMESLAVVNYVSGFNPMSFTSIEKALSYVTSPRNEGRIRMVLLSLELQPQDGEPGIDKFLAALKRLGNIPLVAISERNDSANVENVVALGAVGFLPKAFTLDVFVRFVKDVLRKGQVSGWQCRQCGKLVPMDQVDMLNMRPIKCAYRECVCSDIHQVNFGRNNSMDKAG